MKKLLSTLLLVTICITLVAQEKTPLSFIGIPVDGSRKVFVRHLKKQGFKEYEFNREWFYGNFNGIRSIVVVGDNHGVVDRVMVIDERTSDRKTIISRYNDLMEAYPASGRYVATGGHGHIDPQENVVDSIKADESHYITTFHATSLTRAELLMLTDTAGTTPEYVTNRQRLEDDVRINSVKVNIIHQDDGYRIVIYYNNEKNRPHFEDL